MVQGRAKIGGKNQKYVREINMTGYIKKNPSASVRGISQKNRKNRNWRMRRTFMKSIDGRQLHKNVRMSF
jgi:hypothetical protein